MTYDGSVRHDSVSPVNLPDPTPWPMLLALGVTLVAAGLVTVLAVSAVGALVTAAAVIKLIVEDIAAAPEREPDTAAAAEPPEPEPDESDPAQDSAARS